MPRTAAALALLIAAGTAAAQTYYVDCDAFSPTPGFGQPDQLFGGPAGTPGSWEFVSLGTPNPRQIHDVHGFFYGVTVSRPTNATFAGSDNPNTFWDYEYLFDDYLELADGTMSYTFNNLQPGTYAIYTSAVHPGNAANRSNVTIANCLENCQTSQEVGGTILGAPSARSVMRAGVTHAVHVKRVIQGEALTINVSDGFNSTAVCNGIQVVKLDGDRLRMYVKASATGDNNGGSWNDAFTDLQFALDAARRAGGTNCEIWVAAGIYTPTDGSDRSATFSIPSGLHIYGGFAGTESNLSERSAPLNHGTYLSGAIGSSASTDNSYTVVTLDDVSSNTLVDGFYIARGYNNGGGLVPGYGGGMVVNYTAGAMIRNCDFTTNTASLGGGAIHLKNATVRVINCTFYRSEVYNGNGGAIDSVGPIHTTLTLQNSRFLGNHALGDGGAIYTNFVHADMANCFFSGNSSDNEGGAIKSVGDAQTLNVINCTLSKNSCNDNAGGIYISGGLNAEVRNSILWGNTSDLPVSLQNKQITVNTASGSSLISSFNTIEGLNPNPAFVNAAGPDGTPGTFDDDCHLLQSSPCIDSADAFELPQDLGDMDGDGDVSEQVPFDLDGNVRRIDIPWVFNIGPGAPPLDRGCYEFLAEQWCYANCDNSTVAPTLNVNDFACFMTAFARGDNYANCDGSTAAPILNVNDFTCFLNRFAAGCP